MKNLEAYKLGVVIDAKAAEALASLKATDSATAKVSTSFAHLEKQSAELAKGMSSALGGNLAKGQATALRDWAASGKRAFAALEKDAERSTGRIRGLLSKLSGKVNLGGTSGGGVLSGAASIASGNLVAAAIGKVGGIMWDGLQQGIAYNEMLENAEISFTTLTGSADKAKTHLKDLQTFGATTPFELPGLVNSSQMLQGMGFQAAQVIPLLTGIGNGLSAVGKNSEADVERVTLALGQMASKGKVSFEEMNQLVEGGIPAAWELLAKAIGKTVQQTQKLAEAGKLKGREAAIAITQQANLKYAGQMEKMSQTYSGLKSNFNDAMAMRLGEASRGGFMGLKEFYGKGAAGLGTEAAATFVKEFDAGTAQMLKTAAPLMNSIATGQIFTAGSKAMRASDRVVKASGMDTAQMSQNLMEGIFGDPSKIQDPLDRAFFGVLQKGLSFVGSLGEEKGETFGTAFGAGAQDGSETRLKINLPSEVYIEIGNQTAKGFAIGLAEGTQRFVNPAMDQMLMAGKGRRAVLPLPDRAEANLKALIEKEPAFIPKLKEIADKLQTKPEWLLQLMALETAGTFSPSITNKQGYTGLIQFGAGARQDLGVSQEQLQGMTATRQLDEVLKYFKSNKGKAALDSLTQLYSIVALPAIKNLSESAVVASTKYKPTRFKNNPAWNVIKDDVIYKSELGMAAGGALRPDAALRALGASPSSAAITKPTREDVVVLPKAQLPRLATSFPNPSSAPNPPLPVMIAASDVPLGVEAKKLQAPMESLAFATADLTKTIQANATAGKTDLAFLGKADVRAATPAGSSFFEQGKPAPATLGEKDIVNGGGTKSLFGAQTAISVLGKDDAEIANPTVGQSALGGLAAAGKEAAGLAKEGFAQLAQGVGGMISDFVLLGETGPQAMRKLTASVLASLAGQAAMKSIFYLAEGFAALVWNPADAAKYFTASALMAGIAGGAAIAGRAVASGIRNDSSNSQQQNRDVTSESYAGNRFTYGGASNQPMNQAAYAGDSRSERLLEAISNDLKRLQPVSSDTMVIASLKRNAREVGRATVEAINSDFAMGNRLGQRIAN